jgi:hypothetical protein
MPLFLRTASGKWDGRERPAKIAQRRQRAKMRVQPSSISECSLPWRNSKTANTECQRKLSFAILFFWTKVDHHRRARHHAGPDGDTLPLS